MDLASLGTAIAHRGGRRRRRLVAVTGATAGITAVDLLIAVQATRAKKSRAGHPGQEDQLRAGGYGAYTEEDPWN